LFSEYENIHQSSFTLQGELGRSFYPRQCGEHGVHRRAEGRQAGGLQIVLFNLNSTSSISTLPVMESPSHRKNIGYLEF
jgi:hypothetical protein